VRVVEEAIRIGTNGFDPTGVRCDQKESITRKLTCLTSPKSPIRHAQIPSGQQTRLDLLHDTGFIDASTADMCCGRTDHGIPNQSRIASTSPSCPSRFDSQSHTGASWPTSIPIYRQDPDHRSTFPMRLPGHVTLSCGVNCPKSSSVGKAPSVLERFQQGSTPVIRPDSRPAV
jgi:hypothetical protein